ncbi:MAG TPA: TIGR03862 family flavoprotein [Rhizomicrobium sp.]|nr:TIGR03862 family flavoprotein [Rhizomicrobium sp.]
MTRKPTVAVIGAGPAGLMAAEVLSASGVAVTVYDSMPSVGRKFLIAGRGGLNLTHSEPFESFVTRYGGATSKLLPMLEAFPPSALIAWANGLGQETFVGSSGRVFPKAMKASPLLRAWLARLGQQGAQFQLRHSWRGWSDDGALLFDTPAGPHAIAADATLLALGGASWPKLGSTGGWVPILADHGVRIVPQRPANCGFAVAWSESFRDRFAGQPLKNVALRFGELAARGDALVTTYGLEGGAVYALSSHLRDAIAESGTATLKIDLRPDMTEQRLTERLGRSRSKDSISNILRKAGFSALDINLARECGQLPSDPAGLAAHFKALSLVLAASQPIARAISTAGGVSFEAVGDDLMLKAVPGTFVAGEMLDWEAPTGGYLLQACFATGAFAARAIAHRIGA